MPRTFASLVPVLLAAAALPAQHESPPLDNIARDASVTRIGALLRERYVFADKGQQCADLLTQQLAAGAYAELDDPDRLAAALTEDLQGLTHDKHLRVRARRERPREAGPSPAERERRQLREMQRDNYGFHRVEILAGNVGYLDLHGFVPAAYGGDTATAAMAFLQNTDAIIIDLRRNGGGSPTMIQLLSSYFFDGPTHLNSFFWRGKEQIDQFWTLPHVPGKRRPDVPLWVLTSGRTFSAAEEFTYNLKCLGRATIVGETTGGGAHPGGLVPADDRFEVWIPQGRAINPITGTNWEGTGVEPDVRVAAEQALLAAHEAALALLLERAADDGDAVALRWSHDFVAAQLRPTVVPTECLERVAGTYGDRRVTFDGEALWYQRGGGLRHQLVPLAEDWFQPDGVDGFRIRFDEENGRSVRLVGSYVDGRRDVSERSDG